MSTAAETEQRQAIRAQIETHRSRAFERGDKFLSLGRPWHYANLMLAWGVAALAGLASVSLLSDSKLSTAILAIAAALTGAANAAFNPGRRSQRAYKIGYAYQHAMERADEFLTTRLDYVP